MKISYRKLIAMASINFMIALTNICFAQTEIKITEDSLPASIKKYLHNKFHYYSISNVQIKIGSDGATTYLIDVRKAKNADQNIVYFLVYDSSGKLLDKRKSKEFIYNGTEPLKKTKPSEGDGHNHQH